jgi:glutathione S-transferase
VAGERISVADCTLHAGLNFGRFFGALLPEEFTRVRGWWERFQQRPSVASG